MDETENSVSIETVGNVTIDGVHSTVARPVMPQPPGGAFIDDSTGAPVLLGAEEKANHALAQVGPILARLAALDTRLTAIESAIGIGRFEEQAGQDARDFRAWAWAEIQHLRAAIAAFHHPIR